ncbi:MAG: phasin family protein [Anaerobacillus sp.]|uniref:phasin family protein n=1 Tax=Anaerobacillus sp. TaxID=1872506 RepID=UPI00391C55FD
MRNVLEKGLALGIGLAVKSKEQITAVVDELVKKGEIKKEESNELVNELIQKGEEARSQLDEMIRERMKIIVNDLNLATKTEVDLLEKRIRELEQKQ